MPDTSEPWRVAAGDPTYVSVPGVVKSIACGSKARAALIVRAVNANADLIAALERSREELTLAAEQWLNPNKDGLFASRVSVLIDQIEAAIAKAEQVRS